MADGTSLDDFLAMFSGRPASPTTSGQATGQLNPNLETGSLQQQFGTLMQGTTDYGDQERANQRAAMQQFQQMAPSLYDMKRKAMERRQSLQLLSGLY